VIKETRNLTAISFMFLFYTFRVYLMILPVAQTMLNDYKSEDFSVHAMKAYEGEKV
jgi:hypothetical protein